MANLRVIYDNAADRATLSTSATAANLGYSNLVSDVKSKVARSTSTSLTITATWTAAESISAIVLAFTNLTTGTTIHVQAYTLSTDSTPVFDGTVSSAQGSIVANKGVNSFASGGGVYAPYWLPSVVSAQKVVITVTDAANPQGYVEVGRLVIGNAWIPSLVETQGTTMTVVDSSQQYRTDSGDQWVTVKAKYRKQVINLPSLNSADRAKMWNILYNNGMVKPLFISMWPNNTDTTLEQVHMIYGRLSVNPVMATPYYQFASASVDVEEV